MTEERAAVLRGFAARVDALSRPARVAVDGVTAAGKTTFADELARLLRQPVARIALDDFHRPGHERHARGEGPETYYRDTFALTAFRKAVESADDDALVVADGVFLLRRELADMWSFTIFLAVDRGVALERALARDASRLGGLEAARQRYERRYVPGETLYLEEADPESFADVMVENTDPDRPRLLRTR